MMTEIFVPVIGFEKLYNIGSLGTVKTLAKFKGTNYSVFQPERVKRCRDNGLGYLQITFSKMSTKRSFYLHRLVALHFIPNPGNLPEVNHKDGNKLNCAADNLEWSTRIANEQHAYKTGLKSTGAMWGNSKTVLQYSLQGVLLKEWSCISDIVRALGFHKRLIANCCKGVVKVSYGYNWRFK